MGRVSEVFSPATEGACMFCGEREAVVYPLKPVCMIRSLAGDNISRIGICDVCSYALRHFWQRAQGDRIAAVSPRLVRTYALVPRLPESRLPEDVSAYELLVDSQGGLPYLEFGKSPADLVSHLAERYGIGSWVETLRSCYLGYAGSADFSEVLMSWAWGKVVGGGPARSCKFESFATLLANPTPDAGFYLGVKAAFETLLWKREVGPGEGAPHTFLREPAMRYLGSLDEESEEDPAMIEICHSAMSPEELEVAAYLEGLKRDREEEARRVEEAEVEAAEVEEATADEDVDNGFARPKRTFSPLDEKGGGNA